MDDLLVITNSQSTLVVETIAPETLDALSTLGMCEQEPETKDRLGKDIKNSIGDDLSINRPLASSITDTPDNWVKSPEDQGESTDGSKELSSVVVLGGNSTTTRDDELPDNDKVGNASHGIVSPFLSISGTKGSEETEENHDEICNDGNKDRSTIHSSEESKIQKQERSGQTPIDVSSPENLTEDMLNSVWNMLV